jgi:threonine dehydrogenase-like Zn-dependent dehydrogenase
MMKRVMVHGPGDLRLDNVDDPQAGDRDIVIRLVAAGICGSDFSYVSVGGPGARASKPFGLGHEFAGEVIHAGKAVTSYRVGDRVAYNSYNSPAGVGRDSEEGGFSNYLLLRDIDDHSQSLVRVPENVSMEHAALVEPLSVAMHAVNRAVPKPGETAAVFGLGPIGLGIIVGLRGLGIEDIVGFDLSPLRRERALNLGARAVFDPRETPPTEALGKLRGYDVLRGESLPRTNLYFEATGAPGLIEQIADFCNLGSRIVTVAIQKKPVTLSPLALLGKELSILGSLGYPTEFPDVMRRLGEGLVDPEMMISDRYDFDDFLAAFDHAAQADRAAKVLLRFN